MKSAFDLRQGRDNIKCDDRVRTGPGAHPGSGLLRIGSVSTGIIMHLSLGTNV